MLTLSLLIGWWTKIGFKTVYPDYHAYVVFTDRLVDQVQFQGLSTLTTMLMLSLMIGWWIKLSYKDRLP